MPRYRCFNPPGGFGAFGTPSAARISSDAEAFQSAGRIWGFRNGGDGDRPRPASRGFNPPGGFGAFGTQRMADLCAAWRGGFNPPGGFGAFGTEPDKRNTLTCPAVSIRRADLGLSERSGVSASGSTSRPFQSAGRIWGFRNVGIALAAAASMESFNPPGGFGAFGTQYGGRRADGRHIRFQSAGRIWGFRNASGSNVCVVLIMAGFNPPGGFGAFGTRTANSTCHPRKSFNPPGGFGAFGTRFGLRSFEVRSKCFNPPGGFGAFGTLAHLHAAHHIAAVSIRRADLGLSEPVPITAMWSFRLLFQSAGRIWGFRNSTLCAETSGGVVYVSIRRADLGLSEPYAPTSASWASRRFQSAGRIWGFRNDIARPAAQRLGPFQSAGRIWGFRNPNNGADVMAALQVSIRRADLGLSELRCGQSSAPC
ncbi:hypothetical protein OSCT_0303 [Oscillochloris trichoides DG-6]|uniref:Uncharacterized protein n=1 Tax=Oscillochloris trichoides DG-6 TaxID=765420 RepID=E1IAF2_9CHLR|nr:hypothetical protein OSCT_0303 [Oscillochloris trichoides DG-6]